jgi:lysozyme
VNRYMEIILPILSRLEGCAILWRGKVYPYLDKLSKPHRWTRGYGRTYGISENSDPVTIEQAKAELLCGLEKYAFACIKLAPALAYRPHCLAAVASWTWNCGVGAFKVSRLRRAINDGRWEDAAQHMRTPRTAGGIFSRGLAKRRDIEADLFILGTQLASK